ncbi:ArsR/SmtB family transcription factor [Actinophytocola sp.]|uniref:ArsR/SmtB family transcription factor n=1 Tax=Actinophytocola sp. TaxID=1872138 RepID=UPI003D6BE137
MSYPEAVQTLAGCEPDVVDVVGDCKPWSSPRGSGLSDVDADGIAAVYAALGSPIRLRLLAVIQARPSGEACVCELVDAAGLALSTASHHLAALVASGLVRREQRGTWAWYALVPERLEAARALLARSVLPL